MKKLLFIATVFLTALVISCNQEPDDDAKVKETKETKTDTTTIKK